MVDYQDVREEILDPFSPDFESQFDKSSEKSDVESNNVEKIEQEEEHKENVVFERPKSVNQSNQDPTPSNPIQYKSNKKQIKSYEILWTPIIQKGREIAA